MSGLIVILSLVHVTIAATLWRLQSDARKSDLIDISGKDRCIALFWSPLCGWLLLYGLVTWAWSITLRELRL